MKKIFLAALVLAYTGVQAQNDIKTTNSSIKNVTVFLSKAQISAQASAYVGVGNTDITIEGLPADIDPQSIQVAGKGEFIIKAVKQNLNFLNPLAKAKEITAIEDSLEDYRIRLTTLQNAQEVLTKEEQLLAANQSIKGEQSTLTVEALSKMADFYRSRLTEINGMQLKNELSIKKVNEKIRDMQNHLNAKRQLANRPSSNVIVSVSAKTPMQCNLMLDYIVSNAGWYPVYDLRAKDTKSPIQIAYKAQVYQNTGIDWNNVKLKLSTTNPSLGGTKPELSAWYLNFYTPRLYNANRAYKKERSMAPMGNAERSAGAAGDYEELMKASESVAQYTTVVETTLAAEFDISLPYTIPSDGIGQLVDVQNSELPATYKHFATPKLDKDAFLMAIVTGWDNLNLLSGEANIYFEGSYVGKSFLDMNLTKDTLQLSLGRDNNVVIERKLMKDFTSKKFIGTNKKEEYGYEISVRNTKKEPIEITIEDQYPISQNSEIEVELLDSKGAEVNTVNGKLVWKLKVNGAETQKVSFRYSVKYPKGKTVSGL